VKLEKEIAKEEPSRQRISCPTSATGFRCHFSKGGAERKEDREGGTNCDRANRNLKGTCAAKKNSLRKKALKKKPRGEAFGAHRSTGQMHRQFKGWVEKRIAWKV